jgi:hypothetical protein
MAERDSSNLGHYQPVVTVGAGFAPPTSMPENGTYWQGGPPYFQVSLV